MLSGLVRGRRGEGKGLVRGEGVGRVVGLTTIVVFAVSWLIVPSPTLSSTTFTSYRSHTGIKGTSRPTHHHVLHDEVAFSADDIQILTYRVSVVVGCV